MRSVDVAIVGGGPGGLATASSVLRASPKLKVRVFERAKKLNPVGNFVVITENGFNALEAINPTYGDDIMSLAAPRSSLARFDPHTGELITTQPAFNAAAVGRRVGLVTWCSLQEKLMSFLPDDTCEINSALHNYTVDPEGVTLHLLDKPDVHAKVVIGADGNQSVVRQLCLRDGPPAYLGKAFWRGKCPVPDGWPEAGVCTFSDRAVKSAILATNMGDGTIAWLCTAEVSPEDAQNLGKRYIEDGMVSATDTAKIDRCLAHIQSWTPMLQAMIRSSFPSTVTEHGQYCREPEDCKVWGEGSVTLMGDAAHLSTPFLGQGTNLALEDAVELGRAIGRLGPCEGALREYENARRERALKVQAGSIGLFRGLAKGEQVSEEAWHQANPWVLDYVVEPLVPGVLAV